MEIFTLIKIFVFTCVNHLSYFDQKLLFKKYLSQQQKLGLLLK